MLATISIGINPVAFSLGSLSVHWYGILYVVAFVVAYYLGAGAQVVGGHEGHHVEDAVPVDGERPEAECDRVDADVDGGEHGQP